MLISQWGCEPDREEPALQAALKLIRPDTAYILELERSYDAFLAKSPSVQYANVFETGMHYMDSTAARPTVRFRSAKEYELMLSVAEVEHELGIIPLPIYRFATELLRLWPLDSADLHYLDREGKLVIGDTLYEINTSYQVTTNLKTGRSDTTFANEQSSGRRKTTQPVTQNEIDNQSVTYQVWADGVPFAVKGSMENRSESHLGVRRAVANTSLSAEWVRQEDVEPGVDPLNKLEGLNVGVTMTSTYTVLFKFKCRERTNTRVDPCRTVSVNTGRCPDSGVTSTHTASVRSTVEIILSNYPLN